MLNAIIEMDYALSIYLINLINDYHLFKYILDKMKDAEEVKGLVPAVLFWFLWFYREESRDSDRSKLWAVLAVTVFSISLGRALANFLPFRPRPYANTEIVGSNISQSSFFEKWSSMPSDHAIMFFALAAGFFLISKKIGYIAFAHAVIIVSLPRILLGLHYASDIMVGAAIGVLLSLVAVPVVSRLLIRNINAKRLPDYLLYPLLFFVTYNFATMFNGVRAMGGIAKAIIQNQ